MSRPQNIQNMCYTAPVGSIDATSTEDYYINGAWLLSMMNRKAFHQVTKDGHLKDYGLEIQVFNCVNASTTIRTAPLSYPTYNGTRAWHFARKERYADAGFSLHDFGWGARLRIGLDATEAALSQTDAKRIRPTHLALSQDDMGSWDLSDVVITPPVKSSGRTEGLEGEDTYDSFYLYLCGDHTTESSAETMKYTGAGIIQSWTENRRQWSAPGEEEIIQSENPLAFARLSELSTQQVAEEVGEASREIPPYAINDDDDATSSWADLVINGMIESKFPNPTTNSDIVVAPGGLAKVSITNNDSSAATPFLSVRVYELN